MYRFVSGAIDGSSTESPKYRVPSLDGSGAVDPQEPLGRSGFRLPRARACLGIMEQELALIKQHITETSQKVSQLEVVYQSLQSGMTSAMTASGRQNEEITALNGTVAHHAAWMGTLDTDLKDFSESNQHLGQQGCWSLGRSAERR